MGKQMYKTKMYVHSSWYFFFRQRDRKPKINSNRSNADKQQQQHQLQLQQKPKPTKQTDVHDTSEYAVTNNKYSTTVPIKTLKERKNHIKINIKIKEAMVRKTKTKYVMIPH